MYEKAYQNKENIVTIAIVVINVIVFLVLSLFGMTEDGAFMLGKGAMYLPYVLEQGEYYRLFTSMFLHFGIYHLGNNMLILFLIGTNLEPELGRIKYILVYLLSGLGGNFLSAYYEFKTQDYSISAGASGAIFGVIGAMLFVVIRNKGKVRHLTSNGLLFLIGLSLYYGLTSTGVDNLAHIGGLITGFICAFLLYRRKEK